MTEIDVIKARYERKLAAKDKKIKGLNRRIQQLERAVSDRTLNLTRTIKDTLTDVLCNVRMIPVLNIGSRNEKIVEIRTLNKEKERDHA